MNQVDIAVYNTVHESDMGAKEIAQRLGMSHQILINKSNPNNETHKLTLNESLAVQMATDSTAIIEAQALLLGVQVLPKFKSKPESLMMSVLKATKEHGDVSKKIAEALADGRFTAKEKQECHREVSEAIQSLAELNEYLNGIEVGVKIAAV